MSSESVPFDLALGDVVGADVSLFTELRGAFLDGARAHLAAMEAASTVAVRQAAAWRLHGLAASFGAITLMDRAADVGRAGRLDPDLLRRAHAAIEALAR